MTQISNVRNDVNAKLNEMRSTVATMKENQAKTDARQSTDIAAMKQLLNEEVKDIRAANKQFAYELERNQNLYRALHSELMLTIDEKKAQNMSLVEQGKEAAKEEMKNKKRSGSVSVSNPQALSLQSLLPQLKVAVDQSVSKLTARQVRIANLVKGDNLDYAQTSAMLNQDSALTLKNKFG